jgi:hypothetical protein
MASLEAWLEEWATGDRKENYIDVFLDTGHVHYSRSQRRTAAGEAKREHWFGSDRAPSSDLVRRAIQALGSATALANILRPIIARGTSGPRGEFTDALKNAASQESAAAPAASPGRFRIQFCSNLHTLVPITNFTTVFDSPDRRMKGVYLRCVEYQDALLTNYVGKTWDVRGFEQRIGQQLKEYRAGLYCTQWTSKCLSVGFGGNWDAA